MPRVAIGVLLFNHAEHVEEALDSLLGQTYRDVALLLVDDGSTDGTAEIARAYAARDPRVSFHASEARLGLTQNARRAFALARTRYPEAEYFAWATDHDRWDSQWLARLVDALDATRDAVVAYPLNRRIGRNGELLRRLPWTFDTAGLAARLPRMRHAVRHMRAGNMVYGLFRAGALTRAGVYRRVLVPDRLLLAELALYGTFAQVPEVLWFRRWYGRLFSLERQRASLFPEARALHAYLPWWLSHAASLFRTFVVRGEGRPEVTRAAGVLVAAQYGLLASALDARQGLRALGGRARETAAALGRRARRTRRRAVQLGVAVARGPYLRILRGLRAVPVVRRRMIPALLKPELDEIPAAPAASEVTRELERLGASDGPVLIGPWVGEVGFELLYWIPFLNWAIRSYGLDRRRLVVVSRGGAGAWYRHLTGEYVDVFSLFGLDEYRQANEERWDKAGHQKQYRVEAMDLEILARARARLGLPEADVLHPSLMYRVLRFFWFDKAGIGLLRHHTDYRRFAPVVPTPRLQDLPRDYVAVRFYFRPSFPDTPENRRFAADVVRSITRERPVVLLNTGLRPDEHEDLDLGGEGVYRVDELMQLDQNLEIQTEIVSRASAFVGTYGGLAYLGLFYGVPSASFYSTEAELVPTHLDVSWRVARTMDVRSMVLHTRLAPLLRGLS